jgi:uncharacterized membrane protein (DUF485 family)
MANNAEAAPATVASERRHGKHVDTIESVDFVFKKQRKLSFTFAAVFFAVTLAIPALTNWVEAWWKTEIWGGFTANYLFIGLLYYFFLWGMAWTYAKKADDLDDELKHMAEEKLKQEGQG